MYSVNVIRWYSDDVVNPLEHESDDRANNPVSSVCGTDGERYGTSAANLIDICHCIVVP